jgi:predicted DNA-binding protein (MmcQ/YjbR family)
MGLNVLRSAEHLHLAPHASYAPHMDAERLRAFLLTLPHVVETMQWGDNLVFWVGDKSIGGKMFALINLEAPQATGSDSHSRRVTQHGIMMYAAGPERYPDLLELEGITPAPYLARAHWVAADHWGVFPTSDWQRELRAAHALTLAKLPKKVRTALGLRPTP